MNVKSDWELTVKSLDALIENTNLDLVLAFQNKDNQWHKELVANQKVAKLIKEMLHAEMETIQRSHSPLTYPWSPAEIDILDLAYTELYYNLHQVKEEILAQRLRGINLHAIKKMIENVFFLQCGFDELKLAQLAIS